MKSLIIGGAGFVGPYLARHLKDRGHDVAVTGMPGESKSGFCQKFQGQCGAAVTGMPGEMDSMLETEFYELDVLDKGAVLKLMKKIEPDYVFHLAAQSSVSVSWKEPGLTIDVNIKGSVNVLDAVRAVEKKMRVLLVGSSEEYGAVPAGEMPVREDMGIRPANVYAATKACQNMLGRIYAQAYGLDIVMVRAFNHIGPNQPPLFVAADFCRQAAEIEAGKREPVIRTGNLAVRRDFTDVRDVVRAYALLAQKGQAGWTYNVGSGRAAGIGEILQMILKKSTADIRVETDPSKFRPSDVPEIKADISRLRKAAGWEPKISLEQTVQETLDYWRRKVSGQGGWET